MFKQTQVENQLSPDDKNMGNTTRYLSWSALSFIRAPPPHHLLFPISLILFLLFGGGFFAHYYTIKETMEAPASLYPLKEALVHSRETLKHPMESILPPDSKWVIRAQLNREQALQVPLDKELEFSLSPNIELSTIRRGHVLRQGYADHGRDFSTLEIDIEPEISKEMLGQINSNAFLYYRYPMTVKIEIGRKHLFESLFR